MRDHINKREDRCGIKPCSHSPQPNNFGSHKPNSSNNLEHNLLHDQGTVMMEKSGGRPRDEVWQHVMLLEGGRIVKCKYCGYEFAASANRIKSHINNVKGKGIRVCTGFPQSQYFGSDRGNSNYLKRNLLCSQEAGQIQADDKHQENIQVGSSSVFNGEIEDLQVIQYVFDCLRPEDKVFTSSLSYLTQEEFITLKPETHLDSLVIDIFVEILTDIERKKKTMPSNWYFPVTFSNTALKGSIGHFLNFVHGTKMRENYMSDLESCEKMFIPVYIGAKPHGGHFYLNIIHLKNKEIEIWDSLPNICVAEHDETTKTLLFVMEKLFEEVAFTEFRSKMADGILLQPNGFDCGIFVINFMGQSENYVKRNPSFKFDSDKERVNLALKLLANDLNREKHNLYDKARWYCAQIEKQNGNKRFRVDGVNIHNGREKGSSKDYLLPTTNFIGKKFQSYANQIWKWIMDDKVSAIGVWGTGGSGKTALATHIHNKLLEEASGDIKVIWVTVSQNSISHLQKVMARSLELDISDEFEGKRIAGKLFNTFKEMKKCVVILDDVWDHFFLKEVGFPVSDNQIKLVLTTRIWEVCQGMDCENNIIKVEYLDEEDGWALFENIMRSREGLSLEVERIARNMANECHGLPLAIVRIATSMKGKQQARDWSDMWECMEILGNNGQYEMDKWVLPVLRSSYDFLNNKLQRFFLYCFLSTNGWLDYADVDGLTRRFVYESIDERKLRVQYIESYNMLNKLINHSIWELHYHDGIPFHHMHKFFTALATDIAEDTSKIMAKAYKNLTEIPSDEQWKEDLQKVFLSKNMIQTIPDGTCPRCSQLSTLLLDDNAKLNYIPDDFFNNMPALSTLDLSKTGIERLPKSVSDLKCLAALLLSECRKLSYIPSLEKLKRLISLDLSYTAITGAPIGLESLVNLRYLSFHHTHNLAMIASLISKLINLECLELDGITALGIQSLEKLEVIGVYFQDVTAYNSYVSFFLAEHRVLRSYYLNLCEYDDAYHKEINGKYSMKRIAFVSTDLGERKAILPADIKELFIYDCHQWTGGRNLCSVLSYGPNNNPNQIERLDIFSCPDLEYLYCFSCTCSFCSSSQLVGCLHLFDLMDLKYLVPPYAFLSLHELSLFSHLTVLKIWGCDSMENVMTPKLLALLQNLRAINIRNCEMMTEIVGEDLSELGPHCDFMALLQNDLSPPTFIALPKLTSLTLDFMPQLDFIYRGIMLCPSLQIFSAERCPILNIPRIEVSNGCEIPMKKASVGYHWQIESD